MKQILAGAGTRGATGYEWYKVNIFTTWDRATGRTAVLAFDLPPSVAESLPGRLLDGLDGEQMLDPFWVYVRLVEEVVSLQDRAVWAVRDEVRAKERDRTSADRPRPDYVLLHDLARHAIHVSETLDLSCNTVDGILKHHGRLEDLLGIGGRPGESSQTSTSASASAFTVDRLLFYQDMLRSLQLRSTSNSARLQNEIQLAFNAVAQYDARVSVEIGRAAQADGAAMRTIAFVTMAFLPATFVSAVFSTSFFNYDSASGSWSISSEFWRYWAVAVPVTACTALLWLGWTWLFPPALIGETAVVQTGGETGVAAAKTLRVTGRDASFVLPA